MKLDELILAAFYKHHPNHVDAFDRHVEAMTAGHALPMPQIMQVMELAKNTVWRIDGGRTNMHVTINNGIAMESIAAGQIIGTYFPLVTLPPALYLRGEAMSDMQQHMTKFTIIFYTAFAVATKQQADTITQMFSPQTYKKVKWADVLMPALSMMVTFADFFEEINMEEDEFVFRLQLFALFVTLVVRCPDSCACEILYPPEYYDLVTDNVRPNCMLHKLNVNLPFIKRLDVAVCTSHFMPRVVYAQHSVEIGQFLTVPAINPFCVLEVSNKEHPSKFTPRFLRDSSSDVVLDKLGDMLNQQTCNIVGAATDLAASMRIIVKQVDDLKPKPEYPEEWPCSMPPMLVMHMFMLSQLLYQLKPSEPIYNTVVTLLEKYVPMGFATLPWPGLNLELYSRLCRFYPEPQFLKLRQNMYAVVQQQFNFCPDKMLLKFAELTMS